MKYGKIRERKGVGDDEKLTLFLLAIITFWDCPFRLMLKLTTVLAIMTVS